MKLVYVIYSSVNQAIKVGYASNINQRFSTIQLSTSEPLKLLFTFEGGKEVEKELHTLLSNYRLRGEWFSCNEESLAILLGYQQQLLQKVISEGLCVEPEIIVTEATIIETAINFERLFTVPQLKKQLPSLRLETRDIEFLLLKYGWKIKQYGKSRVKYFYKE